MRSIKDLLTHHPFFSDLIPAYLQILAELATQVHFDAGQHIFEDGDEAQYFYVVLHGRIGLETIGTKRDYVPVQAVDAGEVMGWSWLVPPHRWIYRGRALEATKAIAIDGTKLRILCEGNQDLGYKLMTRFVQVMAQRLEASRWRLAAS